MENQLKKEDENSIIIVIVARPHRIGYESELSSIFNLLESVNREPLHFINSELNKD